jgi:hypothetical protein
MLTVKYNVKAWVLDNFVECIRLGDVRYQHNGDLCVRMRLADLSGFVLRANSCDDFTVSLHE